MASLFGPSRAQTLNCVWSGLEHIKAIYEFLIRDGGTYASHHSKKICRIVKKIGKNL